jgi:hypothetical protein
MVAKMNNITIPVGKTIFEALDLMSLEELAIVQHGDNVSLCYKVNDNVLKVWQSATFVERK